ncbi:MAG: restriction endonuclease subunit S [Desulfovibrionaceae bacterium]
MTAEQLKASILQMAIEGRLVPQRDDEPAVDIAGEVPEDVPFAIPEKWKWVRLRDVIERHMGGGTPSKSDPSYWGGNIPWASVKDMKGERLNATEDFITEKGLTNSTSNLIPAGNIIVCMRMGLGKIAFNDIDVAINQDLRAFFLKGCISREYFFYFYKSCQIVGSGVTVKGIKIGELLSMPIPLPPLAEQRRIVARLEELLPLVEEYGNAHAALKKTEEALPDHLRASLLQEAIQGKLVPQIDDEPAVDVAGEEPEEVPFAIPAKWRWVRIEDIFTLQVGKFIKASEIQEKGMYPCYGGNGIRGYVDKSNRKGHYPLIGRQGALCGNINMADGEFYATEHAIVVDCHEHGDPDCVGYFLRAMNLNQYATATAQPGLAVKNINKVYFPLPPLAEQRRIVACLEELLPHVDAIAGVR